jgi:hypothetical protein
MDQHFLIKYVLNPSGLGDLSEGKALTTGSISILLKVLAKKVKSTAFESKEARSKETAVKLLMPSLSLKACQIRCAFS